MDFNEKFQLRLLKIVFVIRYEEEVVFNVFSV